MLRQWCANGMTYMFKDNNFSWAIRHTNSAMQYLEQAHQNILNTQNYIEQFEQEMELLQQKKLPNFMDFSNYLFPVPADATDRVKSNIFSQRNELVSIYNSKDDIKPFKGTQYGAYMAVTDLASHSVPLRQSKTADEKRFFKLVKGNDWVSKAQDFFQVA